MPPNIKAEYFFIDINGVENKIQIFWANDLYTFFQQENSQYFNPSKYGKYLIPLSYSPSYNIQSKRRFIRLDFHEEIGTNLKIKDLAFFKIKN